MIVKYYADLRDTVGSRQAEFNLPPGSTLRQLVAEMAARYPALEAKILDHDGNLHSHIHIFVNGRDSGFLDDALDTVLDPGATISVFPPVGGG